MKKTGDSGTISRRGFLGAGAVSLAAPAVTPAVQTAAATIPAQAPAIASSGIDVAALRVGQAIVAVQQSDEALGKAAPLVTRYRAHIETLRSVAVATDVEPAFSFDPRPKGPPRAAAPAPARDRVRRPSRPAAPASDLDLAYGSVTQLQAWLSAGQVTSERLAAL